MVLRVLTGNLQSSKIGTKLLRAEGEEREVKASYSEVEAGAERIVQLGWGRQVSRASGLWMGERGTWSESGLDKGSQTCAAASSLEDGSVSAMKEVVENDACIHPPLWPTFPF